MRTLPDLLDEVFLDLRRAYWFMYDRAPFHFNILVHEHLNQVYGEIWIGGSVAWLPHYQDLNSLDYFLWGYLKALAYFVPIASKVQN